MIVLPFFSLIYSFYTFLFLYFYKLEETGGEQAEFQVHLIIFILFVKKSRLSKILKQQLASGYCSISELYTTDLWLAKLNYFKAICLLSDELNAESECERCLALACMNELL